MREDPSRLFTGLFNAIRFPPHYPRLLAQKACEFFPWGQGSEFLKSQIAHTGWDISRRFRNGKEATFLFPGIQ